MLALPASTDKVLAYSEVPDFSSEETVEWAVEMLVLGYETPNLLILAGLSKPVYAYEALPYFEKACRELGLPLRTGEAGVISYLTYLAKQVAEANHVRRNLVELHHLNQSHNRAGNFDFSLLFWAWDDLAYGEAYSDYWPDATPQNMEQLVIETAKSWLREQDGALT